MKLYPMFVLMAAATVLSPGPGVVMTLTNSLRYGMKEAIGGVFGIAVGAALVAGVSATGVGVLLAASASAFSILKLIGAAYLVYLGVRLWRAPEARLDAKDSGRANFVQRFREGISLQLTNPKAIFFFLSVLPQFIEKEAGYLIQFSMLVLTYSLLVVVIHCMYGFGARRARNWLGSERGGQAIKKAGSIMFVAFGIALAGASR